MVVAINQGKFNTSLSDTGERSSFTQHQDLQLWGCTSWVPPPYPHNEVASMLQGR